MHLLGDYPLVALAGALERGERVALVLDPPADLNAALDRMIRQQLGVRQAEILLLRHLAARQEEASRDARGGPGEDMAEYQLNLTLNRLDDATSDLERFSTPEGRAATLERFAGVAVAPFETDDQARTLLLVPNHGLGFEPMPERLVHLASDWGFVLAPEDVADMLD